MTDVAQAAHGGTVENAQHEAPNKLIFRGSQRNLVIPLTLLLAGLMAFTMGMTRTYYGGATAWTFVIWGALFLFSNLLDVYQEYEVTDEGLAIRNPMRIWTPDKFWTWNEIYRLDILVRNRDTRLDDASMNIYHELSGEIVKEREDRNLDAKLAQIIIERSKLQPVDAANPESISKLPLNHKATYHWTKNGSLA
ncbi:MAG: hypothetical protein R3A44_16750 [Caldilineaceae bacterium]